MNKGTVQAWMDRDELTTIRLLAVVQRVAGAVAYLHRCGVSHNAIQPRNVLLTQEDHGSGPQAELTVKLGDLGMASRTSNLHDHGVDLSQFALTVFCMATGEAFASQKGFKPQFAGPKVDQLSDLVRRAAAVSGGIARTEGFPCAAAAAEGTGNAGAFRENQALRELPGLVQRLWE